MKKKRKTMKKTMILKRGIFKMFPFSFDFDWLFEQLINLFRIFFLISVMKKYFGFFLIFKYKRDNFELNILIISQR